MNDFSHSQSSELAERAAKNLRLSDRKAYDAKAAKLAIALKALQVKEQEEAVPEINEQEEVDLLQALLELIEESIQNEVCCVCLADESSWF